MGSSVVNKDIGNLGDGKYVQGLKSRDFSYFPGGQGSVIFGLLCSHVENLESFVNVKSQF